MWVGRPHHNTPLVTRPPLVTCPRLLPDVPPFFWFPLGPLYSPIRHVTLPSETNSTTLLLRLHYPGRLSQPSTRILSVPELPVCRPRRQTPDP